mmetsp:Transcript_10409/g.17881  ORF Transcript_10409/g.17881 Transcript_10409/m.17881 type:complete len:243 (-) Transcript_10409:529-1257(-)
MPAAFIIWAGTTLVLTLSTGSHFSCFLEMPPPTTIRSGQNRLSMYTRNVLTLPPHFFIPRSSLLRTASLAKSSASSPLARMMCPSSALGTNLPSMKSDAPMPVPKVNIITSPGTPFAAPNSTSAHPATSASFATFTRLLPVSFLMSSSTFRPIHSLEIFAAVSTSPRRIAAGNPTPMGPFQLKCFASSPTTRHTSFGDAPSGVGMRCLSVTNSPRSKSTRAPLMPDPPMSIPSAIRREPILS